MHINKNKYNCSGCTACATACPKHCISMQPDGLGFLYPKIDESICIDCGICAKICPFTPDYKTVSDIKEPLFYAGRHKNIEEVENSQSGAAFVVLSDWILSHGGVIYGVGYKEHFRVAHKRASSKSEREEFRGSKYVQSDLTGIFDMVKNDLANGLKVMFTGTPCQTAGLSSFIGKRNRDNLYIMDIVCHGVPGPYVWRDYLKYLERKERKQITAVNFRDKRFKGWRSHIERFTFSYTYTYTYTYMFYTHINLRHSCANCPFTNTDKRPSDITVADFWGIEKTVAARLGEDNKGCSLFILNTLKGKDWFSACTPELDFIQVSKTDCLQPQLQHPIKPHKKREQYEQDFVNNGFDYVRRKYGNVGINVIINKVKDITRKMISMLGIR